MLLSEFIAKKDQAAERLETVESPLTRQAGRALLTGKKGVYGVISVLKNHRQVVIEKTLTELEKLWQIEKLVVDKSDFLAWDEIQEMLESGLVQFGSHTHNHSILTTLDKDEIRQELEVSRRILWEHGVVDPSFIPFCYPNGNCNSEIGMMVKKAGYHMAVTTECGWHKPGNSLYSIKRIGLHNDISSTRSMFACRLAGLL